MRRAPHTTTKGTEHQSGHSHSVWLTHVSPWVVIFCLFLATACKRGPLPPPVVLFDQGHGQRFLVGNNGELDLSGLGKMFAEHGFQVVGSGRDEVLTVESLAGVSTLIISGAFKTITADEIRAVRKFIDHGGQLCIMLHIGQPLAQLLNALGVAVSNGVILEQTNLMQPESATDFTAHDPANHPLTKGISQINLYGAWALHTEWPANVIAKSSNHSWIDLNGNKKYDQGDARQAFSVIVTGQLGHGHFVIFGDDAIFQNRFLLGPNLQLANNLANWLKDGSYYH